MTTNKGLPKVVLLGMLTKMPVGGNAWLVAQYAIGFQRLGFEVYYVECHGRAPLMFMDQASDDGTGKAVGFLAEVMARFGLQHRWAYHALHDDGRCYGLSLAELGRLYAEAELIINLHGGTVPLDEHAARGRLVYMGTDPVPLELELYHGDQRAMDFLEPHVAFFTWGLNYGNPDCQLPWCSRFPFVPSPPPVVLEFWEGNTEDLSRAPFTTIGNWRQQWRDITFNGEIYTWSKHHEFLKIRELPSKVDQAFELALSSYTDEDQRLLEGHGWSVRPSVPLSTDMDCYRDYIRRSRGELTAAKDQNVRLRTGWFSERSATYLAAGRPVIQQDTGFGNAIPSGLGVFAFTGVDDAAAAVETINADYGRHQRAATEVAREYFGAEVVLGRLLDQVGGPSPRRASASSRHCHHAPPPDHLPLQPVSRRPLLLADQTRNYASDRPVPMTGRSRSHPRVSVVIVTFNNLDVTRLCIESVLFNSGDDVEVVLVDNSTEEATRQYVSVLAARNVEVRLLQQPENRGFAAAANAGLTAAAGDTLVLLNNDTLVALGWLDPLLAALRDGAVGLVGPVTNRCGNAAQVPAGYHTYGEMVAFAADRREAFACRGFDIPVAEMFCVAMRRSVFTEVGPLDERFGVGLFEDDDYARRVRGAGLRVWCAEDAFVHHFGEASLGTLAASGTYSALFERNRKLFEAKWGTAWATHERRPDGAYDRVVEQVRRRVDEVLPPSAVVAVVSKGDSRLIDLGGRQAWHFPCMPDGRYAGHYPADGEAARAHLEDVVRRGAEFLVVPAPSAWWLEHYDALAHRLGQCDIVCQDEASLVVDLRASRGFAPEGSSASRRALGRQRRHQLRQLGELVGAVTPKGETVVVVTPVPEDAELPGVVTGWVDPTGSGVDIQLADLVRDGARMAVVPAGDGGSEGNGSAIEHALSRWRLLAERPAIGAVYELDRP